MNFLKIISPGPRTSVQDNGRHGYGHHGLATGGAADRHAYGWANKLLDNPVNAACLEITLGPFLAEFQAPTTIAICGAQAAVHLNDHPVPCWQSIPVNAGDRLALGTAESGLLTYLAVQGGWQTHEWLRSRSVVAREALPQLRLIATGDELAYNSTTSPQPRRAVPADYRPDYSLPLTLGLMPAYQYNRFTADSQLQLLNREYRVSPRCDRMGYQLLGPLLEADPAGILSEGIAYGAVQVPPDGQPFILLRDRQTIGGYPKLGCIRALDADQLSQRRPGQAIYFKLTHPRDAHAAALLQHRFFTQTHWQPDGTLRWR
ncbi:MAG: biotin-dependent carboxyltransferase family protein [Marinobacter sp.]|nr:biotin-dependent carboxyltransferase family protein [Marinobacter sp.]